MKADFAYTPDDRNYFNREVEMDPDLYDITIDYKDDVDLINPTFKCRADKFNNFVNYIYVKSPVSRFYFVNSVTYSQQMVYISCTVDVLASFRNYILKLSGIVERNAVLYNTYLTDTKLKTFNMSRIQTFPWQDGAYPFLDDNKEKEASYILVVSGGGEDEEEEEPEEPETPETP